MITFLLSRVELFGVKKVEECSTLVWLSPCILTHSAKPREIVGRVMLSDIVAPNSGPHFLFFTWIRIFLVTSREAWETWMRDSSNRTPFKPIFGCDLFYSISSRLGKIQRHTFTCPDQPSPLPSRQGSYIRPGEIVANILLHPLHLDAICFLLQSF